MKQAEKLPTSVLEYLKKSVKLISYHEISNRIATIVFGCMYIGNKFDVDR